jgi:hypothetical protein
MTKPIIDYGAASGLAALSICESLILALSDMKLLTEKQAVGVLSDAISAHRATDGSIDHVALHAEAATILERILAGGNSIRRP